MNSVEFIFKAADRKGLWSRPAIYYREGTISYEDLAGRVRRFGGALRAAGIQPGDRVAIAAPDGPEFVVSFLGTLAVGSVAVPVSTRMSARSLGFVLGHCGARAITIGSDQLDKLLEIGSALPDLEKVWIIEGGAAGTAGFADAVALSPGVDIVPMQDDDLAFILYTSGSTGMPKGAMHLHRSIPYTVNAGCRQVLQVEPEDRLYSSSKLFFAYGLGNSLSFPLSSGAGSILVSDKPTPEIIARTIARYSPTIFFAVPSVFRALCQWLSAGNRIDTGSLKFCVSAGEKLPEALLYEWKVLTGVDVLDGIGSTEMLQMVISNERDRIVPGTCGKPVPGYEAKLLDPEGAEILGVGTGDLFIKGGSASSGYWKDPENTAATMQGGWIRMGDIFHRTEQGDYKYEGRSDDLFKVSGQWVTPIEVEEAILACENVMDAAVVCGQDTDGMNIPLAFVVVKPGIRHDRALIERLKSETSKKLPNFMCPAEYRFLSQLPRTETGKLQRFKLRGAGLMPAPREN
ncbi:MAG TPA: benzoate-CoA ligase family protein [Blastocatellia bacterium]